MELLFLLLLRDPDTPQKVEYSFAFEKAEFLKNNKHTFIHVVNLPSNVSSFFGC